MPCSGELLELPCFVLLSLGPGYARGSGSETKLQRGQEIIGAGLWCLQRLSSVASETGGQVGPGGALC